MPQTKYLLGEPEIPRAWYNIRADMPNPAQPVLHPGTGEPIGPDDQAPHLPIARIMQDVSDEGAGLPRPRQLGRAQDLDHAAALS